MMFGAFPSMHVAWPFVVLVFNHFAFMPVFIAQAFFTHRIIRQVSRPWFSLRFGIIHMIWITWAALYTTHHFLTDAIGGVAVVLIVHTAMRLLWCPFPVASVFNN